MYLNLTKEATELLLESTKDPDGEIIKFDTPAGTRVVTNGRNFNEELTQRSTVTWEKALHQLWEKNLVSKEGSNEIYKLTKLGVEYADLISNVERIEKTENLW